MRNKRFGKLLSAALAAAMALSLSLSLIHIFNPFLEPMMEGGAGK